MNTVWQTFGVMGLSLLVMGCQPPQQETVAEPEIVLQDQQQMQNQITEMDQQIRSMVGMAYAEDAKQCRLAEVGHRPCGGPDYYLGYSTSTVDAEVLAKLINEHRQLQQAYQQEFGIMGTCEVIPRPVVTLQGGRCVAVHASDR